MATSARSSSGGSLRRFATPKRGRPLVLGVNHPAVVEGRTLFPKSVRQPGAGLLKSGHNNWKLGAVVQKGRWRGMPIYYLTLEERATCPQSCPQWQDCYGNHMHLAHRYASGWRLEATLERELGSLAQEHPDGFVVRLHALGDFYSPEYVDAWGRWLKVYPALRVFGYTAHEEGPILDRIRHLRSQGRFFIRESNRTPPGGWGAVVLGGTAQPQGGDTIVCPAQEGKTECCATCALCWSTPKHIAFIKH